MSGYPPTPLEIGALHLEYGRPLHEHWYIPRDQFIALQGEIIVHPSIMMKLLNNGRTPLWTRHMAGVREAERDRRKHAKAQRLR